MTPFRPYSLHLATSLRPLLMSLIIPAWLFLTTPTPDKGTHMASSPIFPVNQIDQSWTSAHIIGKITLGTFFSHVYIPNILFYISGWYIIKLINIFHYRGVAEGGGWSPSKYILIRKHSPPLFTSCLKCTRQHLHVSRPTCWHYSYVSGSVGQYAPSLKF